MVSAHKASALGFAFIVAANFTWTPTAAQTFTYTGCDPLSPTDFTATELFNKSANFNAQATDATLSEPVQMALQPVHSGGKLSHVDIYFVERKGKVKHFNGLAKTVKEIGNIKVQATGKSGNNDNGLMGIAAHPDFATNRWLFLWYTPPAASATAYRRLRLTRITVKDDFTLDMDSEKILIDATGSQEDMAHSGGPMTFDANGDLWVTVGNNGRDLDGDYAKVSSTTDSSGSMEWGSSNTHSLRGGIFRIHPDNSPKGYSIPAGNFGEYWAKEFEKQGKAELAAQYRDTADVLPEVYVKGSRSNYSVAVHPTKGWLAWGEVNDGGGKEELNLVDHPIFGGYPYFHSSNIPTGSHNKDPLAPANNSPFNSGATILPPTTPGVINGKLGSITLDVSLAGGIYVFDRSLDSKTKFPPHLDNTWVSMSFDPSHIYLHALNKTTPGVEFSQRVDNGLLSQLKARRPLQAVFGPEGSLYLLNYGGTSYYTAGTNAGVIRLDYTGACTVPVSVVKKDIGSLEDLEVTYSAQRISIREMGRHEVTLHDLQGNLLGSRSGEGRAEYLWQDIRGSRSLSKGLYVVRVKTAKGVYQGSISRL